MSYETKEEVIIQANTILNKSLRQIIPEGKITQIEEEILKYKDKRKGYLGELVEWYVFGKKPDNKSEADFNIAGVELKTTPLKTHKKNIYAAKERLVFSKIDYKSITNEKWESSSFLKKNKYLLVLFYLYIKEISFLDYEFKYVKYLDLIHDISEEDILQIQKDWEFIVSKIKEGHAHLLSEGDTFYLGACTKAKDSSVVCEQFGTKIPAKPRAFSLKPTYLNYLIQTKLLSNDSASLLKQKKPLTIEENITSRLRNYVNKSDINLAEDFGIEMKDKSWRRRLIIKILTGKSVVEIEEIKKANITMKVVNVENNGSLKESISFPGFDFIELINEDWYLDLGETIKTSNLYSQLDENKFMFVVFQKEGNVSIFRGAFFWNFPQERMIEAERVWNETKKVLLSGDVIKKEVKQKNDKIKTYNNFPGLRYNDYLHVRPHASDKEDVINIPVPDNNTGRTEFTKQCFWLNAKYIEKVISENLPNINKK